MLQMPSLLVTISGATTCSGPQSQLKGVLFTDAVVSVSLPERGLMVRHVFAGFVLGVLHGASCCRAMVR